MFKKLNHRNISFLQKNSTRILVGNDAVSMISSDYYREFYYISSSVIYERIEETRVFYKYRNLKQVKKALSKEAFEIFILGIEKSIREDLNLVNKLK